MSILQKKYPIQPDGRVLGRCALYGVAVAAILFFLRPFGLSIYYGNKLLVALLFGLVTFGCSAAFKLIVNHLFQKSGKTWRVWHQVLSLIGMVLFIGLGNAILYCFLFHFPITLKTMLVIVYWTLAIGLIIAVISTALSYYMVMRRQLEALLDKKPEAQQGVSITLHDTRVRGNDLALPINDLLYLEAQKNNVAVCYVKDGKLKRSEIHTTLAAVLKDLGGYGNIFQCHRSFAVNLNSISSASGNSNGYTLILGNSLATVPVSRPFVPKLKSFIS